MSQRPPEMRENVQDPGLYCMLCRKKVGLTYSPYVTQTTLMLEAKLALLGEGKCVNPNIRHQTPLVPINELPPLAVAG